MTTPQFQLSFECPVATSGQMVDGKFHCRHCDKQVHDASAWSPQEIDFRLRQAGGSLCVSISPEQLAESPEFVLMRAAKRKLRFWETFLLAFLLAWGFITVAPAQTLTAADSAAIEQIYADYDNVCRTFGDGPTRHGGSIVRRYWPWRLYEDWDSLGLVNRQRHDGREIIVLSEPIFFLKGNAEICATTVNDNLIQERDFRALFQSLSIMLDFPWKRVVIYGHADASEPDPEALSLQRATYIAQQMQSWGLNQQVEVKGMGARDPYDEALRYGTYAGRNRRVTIVLLEPRKD